MTVANCPACGQPSGWVGAIPLCHRYETCPSHVGPRERYVAGQSKGDALADFFCGGALGEVAVAKQLTFV